MADGFIASDVHIAEPFDLFTTRLPKHLRDRAMRVEHDPDGDLTRVTGFGKDLSRYRYFLPERYFYSRSRPVSWMGSDPEADLPPALLRDLEADGVYGAVVGPEHAREACYVDDHELAIAHARAYNDFVAEVYGPYRDRLCPLAPIPLTDVDDAVAEIERVAGLGLNALAFPADAPEPIVTGHYDRVWAAAEANEMIATFHVGTGFQRAAGILEEHGDFADMLSGMEGDAPLSGPVAAGKLVIDRALAKGAEEGIANLVGSGVTHRFPDLQFVFLEFNAYWLAALMASMEKSFTLGIGQNPNVGVGAFYPDGRMTELARVVGMNERWPYPLRPSEYVRRQIHLTFQDDPLAIANRAETGVEALLWSNDYPHPEGTHPDSRAAVEKQFEGVDQRDRDAIVGGTAAELFGIKIPV